MTLTSLNQQVLLVHKLKQFMNVGIKVDNKKVNWHNIPLRTITEDLEVDMVKGDVS